MKQRILLIAFFSGLCGMALTFTIALFSHVRIEEALYRGVIGFGVLFGVGGFSVSVLQKFGVLDVCAIGENIDVIASEEIDSELLRKVLSSASSGGNVLEDVSAEKLSDEEKRVAKFVEEHPEEAARVLEDITREGS